jgi:hypothetical protein
VGVTACVVLFIGILMCVCMYVSKDSIQILISMCDL